VAWTTERFVRIQLVLEKAEEVLGAALVLVQAELAGVQQARLELGI
jgi:hypothetical protein